MTTPQTPAEPTTDQQPDDAVQIDLSEDTAADSAPPQQQSEVTATDDGDAELTAGQSENDQNEDGQEEETEQLGPADDAIKIVIWIRQGITSVGFQGTNTDPQFETIASEDPVHIFAAIPEMLQNVRTKWAEQPLQKKHEPPARLATPARPTTPARTKNGDATKPVTPQLF